MNWRQSYFNKEDRPRAIRETVKGMALVVVFWLVMCWLRNWVEGM